MRKKAISGDRQSLYLDFYPAVRHPHTGKTTRREFLKLYVLDNPHTQVEKGRNKETMQLAELIRNKRDAELNKPEIYSGYELEQLRLKELGKESFMAFFKELIRRKKSDGNVGNWRSALYHLEKFAGPELKFEDITEKFANDFKDYLLTAKQSRSSKFMLSQNSALSYFNKFKAALRQAFKDDYLRTDLNAKISPIKALETERAFLYRN